MIVPMRLSRFHLHTEKTTPADAEIISHQLMLKSGMLRKLAAGIYTWTPLGLRVLRKVEAIVREEMDAAGSLELLMPGIQPRELWEKTGRWEKFGGQLLKLQDRKDAWYCVGPTHEEVVTDLVMHEVASYKQLPLNFYQIQTKFRDEIRPRFGVMRSREFIMKDAYSFDIDEAGMAKSYQTMHAAYTRIFTRLGLKFRSVQADSGAIGGDASQEFHVLADSGEDAIVFSTASDYAANLETARAAAPGPRPTPTQSMHKVETPIQKTCEAVAELLGIPLSRTVKSVALMAGDTFILALVRGDHSVNEIKLAKLDGMDDYRLASEEELMEYLGSEPGFPVRRGGFRLCQMEKSFGLIGRHFFVTDAYLWPNEQRFFPIGGKSGRSAKAVGVRPGGNPIGGGPDRPRFRHLRIGGMGRGGPAPVPEPGH